MTEDEDLAWAQNDRELTSSPTPGQQPLCEMDAQQREQRRANVLLQRAPHDQWMAQTLSRFWTNMNIRYTHTRVSGPQS